MRVPFKPHSRSLTKVPKGMAVAIFSISLAAVPHARGEAEIRLETGRLVDGAHCRATTPGVRTLTASVETALWTYTKLEMPCTPEAEVRMVGKAGATVVIRFRDLSKRQQWGKVSRTADSRQTLSVTVDGIPVWLADTAPAEASRGAD